MLLLLLVLDLNRDGYESIILPGTVFLYKIEKKILIMLQLFKIIHAEVFIFLVIFWAIKDQVLYSPETDTDPKPIS